MFTECRYKTLCLLVAGMKIHIFWDVTQCGPLIVNVRVGTTYCLHLQGRRMGQAGTGVKLIAGKFGSYRAGLISLLNEVSFWSRSINVHLFWVDGAAVELRYSSVSAATRRRRRRNASRSLQFDHAVLSLHLQSALFDRGCPKDTPNCRSSETKELHGATAWDSTSSSATQDLPNYLWNSK
jgi:hypothetical protein